jgi:hypothetical protein
MANKIDQLKIGTTSYDIDLPPDATPSIASLTVGSGASHAGVKVGNTYINAINGDLVLQNNSAVRFGGDS